MTDRSRKQNRLAGEVSPYLLQHAQNPVDWYPWGKEALRAATERDVPILLSIGYSACHWCHVMERECFEDPRIAELMNDRFVCVKVDREERPDLDHVYQLVVQLMGRNGGWPLTVFLTPDQRPIFAGTYFPPADRYGMPGLPRILDAISDAYATRRDDVELQARELTTAIERVTARVESSGPTELDPTFLERPARRLAERSDDEHGGFGTKPKFPNTMPLEVLLRHAVHAGDGGSKERVRRALDAMRAGGVRDQLGGGFHRYSTDAAWLVPHFEKMLYDNALLLRLYVDASRAFGEARYAETARSTARYVLARMTAPGGGFYATEDADSEGEEGRYFVWTPGDVETALADAPLAALAMMRFGVTPEGNFERSGASVLSEAKTVAELAARSGRPVSEIDADVERARLGLLAARSKRVAPFRDEKVLTSWNGLMIGAMAEASRALGEPSFLAAAEASFAFVVGSLAGPDETLMRHTKDGMVRGPGFLDDYAFMAMAALDLYEATGKPGYVAAARRWCHKMTELFWDDATASFFLAPKDGEPLIVRAKDPYDQAIPSGASMALSALLRLSVLVEPACEEIASRGLLRVAGPALENPFAFGQTLCAIDRLVRGPVEVVFVGAAGDPRLTAMADAVYGMYLPNRTVAWLDPGDPMSRSACAVLAEGKAAVDGTPVAYVCRGQTCSPPVTTPDELRRLLERR